VTFRLIRIVQHCSFEHTNFVGNWKLISYSEFQNPNNKKQVTYLDGVLSITQAGYVLLQIYSPNRKKCKTQKLFLATDDELRLCFETCKTSVGKIINSETVEDLVNLQIEIKLCNQTEFVGQTRCLQLKKDTQLFVHEMYQNQTMAKSIWEQW